MIRLTFLLLAGLGLAMYFADSFPEAAEKPVNIARPKPVIVEKTPQPEVQTTATVNAPAKVVTEPENPEIEAPVVVAATKQPSYLDLFESPAIVGSDGKLEIREIEAADTPDITVALQAALEQPIETTTNVWFVTGERVNVREGPTTSAAVVEQVIYAEAVQVLNEPENGWVMIRIEGDGVEGYMANRFLQQTDPQG